MNKKIIISIIAIVLISIIVMVLIIPAYLYRQSDDLLTIMYVCTTGLKPTGFSAWRIHDNGTHTIDMDSCAWIKNTNYKPASMEYQEINGMSCDELIQRHTAGEPYQNKENKIFAQEKIINCNYVQDYDGT